MAKMKAGERAKTVEGHQTAGGLQGPAGVGEDVVALGPPRAGGHDEGDVHLSANGPEGDGGGGVNLTSSGKGKTSNCPGWRVAAHTCPER